MVAKLKLKWISKVRTIGFKIKPLPNQTCGSVGTLGVFLTFGVLIGYKKKKKKIDAEGSGQNVLTLVFQVRTVGKNTF